MKINPTVGRVVYFNPNGMQLAAHLTPPKDGEPLAAIITAVVLDDRLNLAVFDADGQSFGEQIVPLVQEGEQTPMPGIGFAYWMPYQLAQAGIKPMAAPAAPAPTASTSPAPKVEETRINALMASLDYKTAHLEGTTSTVATARLPGGFVVAIGHSATVHAANFDPAKGREYAIASAERKARSALWEFEGYALYLRLEQLRAAGVDTTMPAHQQRVMLERFELVEKADALARFIGTRDQAGSIYGKLPEDEQMRLCRQLQAMRDYSEALAERIAAFPKVAA
jgi:hypothetical protein